MAGHRRAFAALLVLAATSGPDAAAAQDAFSDRAQSLASCAGAVAAYGGLDVLEYPSGAGGEWAPLLGAILEALNREEGLEGMTGRHAANAARAHWASRPRAEQEAQVVDCRVQFAGN